MSTLRSLLNELARLTVLNTVISELASTWIFILDVAKSVDNTTFSFNYVLWKICIWSQNYVRIKKYVLKYFFSGPIEPFKWDELVMLTWLVSKHYLNFKYVKNKICTYHPILIFYKFQEKPHFNMYNVHTYMFEVHHVFISQNLKKLKEGKVCRSAQLVLPTFYNSDIYYPSSMP